MQQSLAPYPEKIDETIVQQTIIALRDRLHLTQRQMAKEMGLGAVTLCRWESTVCPESGSIALIALYAQDRGVLDLADRLFAVVRRRRNEAASRG